MGESTAEVLICGAGIAGISAAYYLSVNHGIKKVVLVDENPPLSLTSDKSTECYRNWWPGPGNAMVSLMNRSIDILEELAYRSDNIFNLNRRGYLYVTADPNRVPDFKRAANEAAQLGAGAARTYTGQPGDPIYTPAPPHGFDDQPAGADVILDQALIRSVFPCLPEETVAVVHARRAGWFSAQQLGMYLLEQAKRHGARLFNDCVGGVEVSGGRVRSVRLGSGRVIATRSFVNAAGPFITDVAKMIGVDLPVFNERHVKVSFNDHLGALPRDAPLLIWTDPQYLPWSDEERAELSQSDADRRLLDRFPSGVHGRPEGGAGATTVLLLWTYDADPIEPVWPIPYDPMYPEIALRGMATMIPNLKAYFNKLPRFFVDGGYYTKTRENRFLACPLPVAGAYLIGALSGYGLMAACGAGELLAAHVTGSEAPSYAAWFRLERYEDPEYQKVLENWGASGQL